MADQSKATGFSSSVISQIETGKTELPDSYLSKLAEWMQLEKLELHQLKLLARLRQKSKKQRAAEDHDLIQILNGLAIKK